MMLNFNYKDKRKKNSDFNEKRPRLATSHVRWTTVMDKTTCLIIILSMKTTINIAFECTEVR